MRITFLKKNYAEAEIVQILEASEARITPPCPHWQACGGCSWQHITYQEQLNQKASLIQESMQKFSGFEKIKVETCIASPLEFRYRNRIQIHALKGQLGFFKKNTHEIVPIDDCLITDEKITQKFAQIRKESLKKKLAKSERIELKIDSAHHQSDLDAGFSQVNSAQNEKLRVLVGELAQGLIAKNNSKQIFDLYCGGGNLSFSLAQQFKNSKIIGVELSPKNISDARNFLRVSKHEGQIEFHQSKVEEFLRHTTYNLSANLVVLDPPRTGCDPEVMKILAEKKPHSIIYVSCHPATLARDLKFLSQDYVISKIQPIDMFPQTDHVECIVGLERVELESATRPE